MSKEAYERTPLGVQLPAELEDFIHDTNPWWRGEAMRPLPLSKRWLFEPTLQRLKSGLAPVTVIRGPRQVGKTTLQEHLIEHFLHVEHIRPERICRIQFDEIPSIKGLKEPILSICRWFEQRILKTSFNQQARQNEPAFIFFDEVQNLADWATQVKALVDHQSVRVLLTGSSALRIERGRDSLAGRISTLELNTLLLREIGMLRSLGNIPPLLSFNGLQPLTTPDFWRSLHEHGLAHRIARDKAFAAFSERGGYPLAQARSDRPWEELSDQLNETVIRRVIQHDLRLGERGRKRDESLLDELFRLCCRYAGQAPGQSIFATELRSALMANVGWQKILTYLRFLNDTLLIRMINPLELRLKKRKGRPKICLCDHALRASWLQELIPLEPNALIQSPHLSDLAGHIAESVAGYFLGTLPGVDLAWFPERGAEPEVDFVLTVGTHRIPIEIKYRQRVEYRDTLNLRAFIEKSVYNAPFGIMITLLDETTVSDHRIITLPLSSLLLMR